MKINGLTVCVQYSDFLAIGIERWLEGLETLTVVTDSQDAETVGLVAKYQKLYGFERVRLALTNLFYADGATFNKARSMEWARRYVMPWRDWILFFDADVVPGHENWLQVVEKQDPQPGRLYGCWRLDAKDASEIDRPNLKRMPHDVPGVGYFQLFHSSDPVVQCDPPLLHTAFVHAGGYDNIFMDRWRSVGRKPVALPLRLVHLGPHDQWFGRDNTAAFDQMQAERRAGKRWQDEVIPGPMPVD